MKLRLGIAVGLFMALLSLYPQFYFQIGRGENYKGATFYYDFDESAYASYLQALIDGRPRKTIIYQGSDKKENLENLFSIQFASAYLVAIPAKLLGLSSEKAFLLISVLFAFFAGLTIYFLLFQITENPIFSAVGTLFILLFGANAAGASILKETFGFGASAFYLSFLRRYTPGVVFPFVFLTICSVWLGLKTSKTQTKFLFAFLAVCCFAFLTFGYFFFWTATLAWIVILFFLNFVLQKENRNWKFWLVILFGIILTLIPYFWLMMGRNPTADSSQVLELTRKIVFLRPTLLIGSVVLIVTVALVKLRKIELRNLTTIFILSFAALPIVVFNQQVFTGLSLQPMHYNMYILNYLILLGLVLLVWEVFKTKIEKLNPLIWVFPAIIFCTWGIVETNYTINYRYGYNLKRDDAYPVNLRLAEIGKDDFDKAETQITLNFDSVQGDNQPTVAPQGVLWAEHLFFGGNLSSEEHQRRYFLYLYFQNFDGNQLRLRLQNCPNEQCRALIGWRVNPTLSFSSSKIETDEVNRLVESYANFTQNITAKDALNPTISYLIIPNDMQFDLTNFEKWYQKDQGEKLGNFTLFKTKTK